LRQAAIKTIAVNKDVELGAWIVAAHKVLSRYSVDQPALDSLEAIVVAGRTADLFSATRSLGKINHKKFEVYRKIARLRPSDARDVLKAGEKLGCIEVTWSTDPSRLVEHFKFKTDTKEAVLEAAAALFMQLNPTGAARGVLDAMAFTLYVPQPKDDVVQHLVSLGYEDDDVEHAIRLVTELEIIGRSDETEDGEIILFNPHAFEGNATEAFKVLNSLNPTERQRAQDILQHVAANPGIPFPKTADEKVLAVLIKIGLVDYSKITTTTTARGEYFPTAPYIWGVFGNAPGKQLSKDVVDDSKLLLNSLRYGQYFSQPGRGQILQPAWIVNALLRDGAIGVVKPATAIGEDYPLALSRGIVNVVESPRYPGRYSMELLKRDVAETVGELLEQRTILPAGQTPSPEEVERAGKFISPGVIRVESELPSALKKYQDELVFGLRTMRKGK
jgi:hypothetical protein